MSMYILNPFTLILTFVFAVALANAKVPCVSIKNRKDYSDALKVPEFPRMFRGPENGPIVFKYSCERSSCSSWSPSSVGTCKGKGELRFNFAKDSVQLHGTWQINGNDPSEQPLAGDKAVQNVCIFTDGTNRFLINYDSGKILQGVVDESGGVPRLNIKEPPTWNNQGCTIRRQGLPPIVPVDVSKSPTRTTSEPPDRKPSSKCPLVTGNGSSVPAYLNNCSPSEIGEFYRATGAPGGSDRKR